MSLTACCSVNEKELSWTINLSQFYSLHVQETFDYFKWFSFSYKIIFNFIVSFFMVIICLHFISNVTYDLLKKLQKCSILLSSYLHIIFFLNIRASNISITPLSFIIPPNLLFTHFHNVNSIINCKMSGINKRKKILDFRYSICQGVS